VWLYVPSTGSRSVPGSGGSTSPSDSPSPDIALCVIANSTHSRRPLSWPGWRKRPWIALLSGTTSAPSTADAGVDSWISSTPGFPASRSRQPEGGGAPRTSGGSGPASRGSFARWARRTCSWRMFQASLAEGGSVPYSGPWPTSGTMLGGRLCSPRTSGPRTGGPGSSSWAGGPAPREDWPTPSSGLHNYDEDPARWEERRRRLAAKHGNDGAGLPLGQAAQRFTNEDSPV